jgi:hypothetical protein
LVIFVYYIKQYQIEVSNRFAARENLNDSEDINRALESTKDHIKSSAKESLSLYALKQHKRSYDEEYLRYLDQRKQTKMQCLRDLNHSTVDNLNHVRLEAIRDFRDKRKEYLKTKSDELKTNSKIKTILSLYMGISDFNKGYQTRTNIIKDEEGDLVTDCHSILARWKNNFSPLLNVHGVNDVRQTEIHTAERLVPEPSAFEFDLAIEKLKVTSPVIDRIPAELFKAGGRTIRYEIHTLFITI